MADNPQPQKTDPHLRFTLFKRAENTLVEKLKEHEREIKRLLAELETIRNLLEEASDDIEQEDIDELKKEHARIKKQQQALEEMVEESAKARDPKRSDEQNNPSSTYTAITPERLTIATSYSTRQELYQLKEKEEWTKADAYRFFEISDAVKTSQQYSFSEPIQENVEHTYSLLKDLAKTKSDEINSTYNPAIATAKLDQYKQSSQADTIQTDRTTSGLTNTTAFDSSFKKEYSTFEGNLSSPRQTEQQENQEKNISTPDSKRSSISEDYKK
ncbi:MAG: hypothetical protein ACOCU6_01755 [Nanoarchaeota archaeon]